MSGSKTTRVFILAASIAAFAPVAAAANGTDNIGLQTVPLTLVNNSGTGRDLYLTIIGLVGSTWYCLTDANGDVQAAPDNPNLQSFSIDVGSAPQVALNLPQLVGARLYVSVGAPLMLTSAGGTPSAPAGWVAGDPNYATEFDWIEYTWTGGPPGALGGNTTQVDMFGLALQMTLTGNEGTLASGFDTSPGNHVRTNVLAALAGAGSPWSALVINDASGNPLRAISPYHGIENNVFPPNELQSYLDQAFSNYPSGGLATNSVGASYTGVTTGNAMVFTNSATGASFTIPEPSTYTALTGGIAASPAPSDPATAQQADQIAAQLQATLLRTALLSDNGNLLDCNTQDFYANAPVDEYAQILHANALDGHTYAFGFDDECGQSSYINVTAPTSMTLSVGPVN